MKKIIASILVLVLTCASTVLANSADLETSGWYEYNNHSGSHSFSLRFPTDWKVKTFGPEERGLLPEREILRDPPILIRHFEGHTYNEVITHYITPTMSFVQEHDFLFETPTEDMIAKEVYFVNKTTGESIKKIMIRRGSQIVVITEKSDDHKEITDAITNSFRFTDGWKAHIDYVKKHTFIIPANYSVEKTDERIVIKNVAGKEVFTIKEDKMIDRAQTHITNEIRESFEFFDIPVYSTYPFKHFIDVRDNHPNAAAINELVDRGIIGGYEDGTFRPDDPVNRAELIKMIFPPILEIVISPRIFRNCFVDARGEWFESQVCFAKAMGWIDGYSDGTFRPEEKVNRAEGLKIILEATKGRKISPHETLKNDNVEDISEDSWYAKYFIHADNRELLDKQHVSWDEEKYRYYPSEKISRKEVAEMIFRIKYH